MENALLHDEDNAELESVQYDGIWVTPDYFSKVMNGLGVDAKTTNFWPDKNDPNMLPKPGTDRPNGYPPTWEYQFGGYAIANGRTSWAAIIFYQGATELIGIEWVWTHEELSIMWEYVQMRRKILDRYVNSSEVPQPFSYNEDWECKTCPYLNRCQGASQ